MSKNNRTYTPTSPKTGTGSSPSSDTSRLSREIASFYSEEMSKEAVGSLFRGFDTDTIETVKDEEIDKTEKALRPAADRSEKNVKPEKSAAVRQMTENRMTPVRAGDDEENDFMNYIKSYSTLEAKKPQRGKGVSEDERASLTPNSSSGSRKTSVSLASPAGGKTRATIKRVPLEEVDDDDDDEEYDDDNAFSFGEFLASNMRYIAAIAAVIALVVMVALIININSVNAKLETLTAENERLQDSDSKYQALSIQFDELGNNLAQLNNENNELKQQIANNNISANNDPNGNVSDPDNGQGDENPTNTTPPTGTETPTNTTPPATTSPNSTTNPGSTSGNSEYIVKENDTLWGIASKFYGNGLLWTKIAQANGLQEGANLKIGSTLIIPPK